MHIWRDMSHHRCSSPGFWVSEFLSSLLTRFRGEFIIVTCQNLITNQLTRFRGEWMHCPSSREQRLHSPWERWQKAREWQRESSNGSEKTFPPEESDSGPACLHQASCHKPPSTSSDFQQKVSQKYFSSALLRFLGQEWMFGWRVIWPELRRPCLTSSFPSSGLAFVSQSCWNREREASLGRVHSSTLIHAAGNKACTLTYPKGNVGLQKVQKTYC